jgi:cytochrome c-type biogenesis protein CcmH/NrfF
MNLPRALSLSLLLVAVPSMGASGWQGQVEPRPETDSSQEWNHIHEGPYAEVHLALEKAIRCNCGCLLDLHLCQTQMQCGTSPVWSQRILRSLEEGESEETILAGFSAEFGPSVLMTPPTEGFNWVGYLLPWVAILSAATVLGTLLRKRGIRSGSGTDPDRNLLEPEEWERVSQELARLEDEERHATEF